VIAAAGATVSCGLWDEPAMPSFFFPDTNFAGTNVHFGHRRKVCSLVVIGHDIYRLQSKKDKFD
jgi:hypothetical protein